MPLKNLNFAFTVWDLALLIAVTLMGTTLAYLHNPKWKAFILSLPIPFTLANLSLGQGVDATHLIGLPFLMLYFNGVRWLHLGLGLSIVLSIILAAGSYAVLGVLVAGAVPRTETAFWSLAVAVFLLSLLLVVRTAHRQEPGHRTPLPVWIKLPIVMGVIFMLIVGKKMLMGLMTTFPMVGLLAAYEGRHSLWTMCRAIYLLSLWMVPMMVTIHVTQSQIGLGSALALGWVVYLSLMIPFTLRHWRLTEQ